MSLQEFVVFDSDPETNRYRSSGHIAHGTIMLTWPENGPFRRSPFAVRRYGTMVVTDLMVISLWMFFPASTSISIGSFGAVSILTPSGAPSVTG